MKPVLFIVLFISQLGLYAQWYNLGNPHPSMNGSHYTVYPTMVNMVQMSSDGIGYKARLVSGTGPLEVYYTHDDWATSQKINSFFTHGHGCCSIDCIFTLDDSICNISLADQSFSTIHQTTDYGVSWSTLGSAEFRRNMEFFNKDFGYSTITTNNIIRFRLGKESQGLTYLIFNADSLTQSLPGTLDFTSPSNGYFSASKNTNESYVFHTQDSGATWSQIYYTQDLITSICFPDSALGYICTINGSILKTQDAGQNWSILNSPMNDTIYAIDFLNDSLGFISGVNGQLYKTTDGGINWTMENTGVSSSIVDVYWIKENVAYAQTMVGDLLKMSFPNSIASESQKELNIRISPNPTNGEISILTDYDKKMKVNIYNQLGKLVLENIISSSNFKKLSLPQSAGIYFVRIEVEGRTYTEKVVKH